MRVLLDTNIILDVLLNRMPWVKEASDIWQNVDDGRVEGFIVASTITNIFYIIRKISGADVARDAVRTCLDAFQICEVNHQTLLTADKFSGKDFEDNLQIACAELNSLDAIITRDKGGFQEAGIAVWSPGELLARIP